MRELHQSHVGLVCGAGGPNPAAVPAGQEGDDMNDVAEVPVTLTRESADGAQVPVKLYVEARRAAGEAEVSNKVVKGLEQVTGSIEAVAANVARAVRAASPDAFTVELGFEMKAEAGGLVAMLVRSGGTATIKVILEWGTNGS